MIPAAILISLLILAVLLLIAWPAIQAFRLKHRVDELESDLDLVIEHLIRHDKAPLQLKIRTRR